MRSEDVILLLQLVRHGRLAGRAGEVHAPIGIAYVAAMLRSRGITASVHMIDCEGHGAELPPELLDGRPAMVGISATGNEIPDLLRIAELVRRRSPDSAIVAGGYCSLEAERLLASGHVDVVVIGEGEETMAELVPVLRSGAALAAVRGICYRVPGCGVVRTPSRSPIQDLDALPVPSYAHSPPTANLIRVYASRGCPYDCTFCRIKDYYGTTKIRAHGADWIRRLVAQLLERSSGEVAYLYFNDDEFLLDAGHLERMAGVARDFGLKICFQTRTQDVLRHRDVLLRHLDVIYQIHMGVESFAQSQLDRWSKRVKVQVNLEAMRLLAGLGICYYPYLILSDERTTVEEIAANCGGILELPPRPFSVRMGGQERSAVMHPLHSGLHLNRLKDLHGRVVRAAATRYLEAVWDFIGGTYEEAARLSDLYVYSLLGPQRAAGGAPVPKPFESGAALLEERVSRIAEIADTAATLSVAAARKAARAAAEAFRRVATRTRVDYMSGALWAPSRAVTSASDPTLRQRPRVDRPWGPSGLPAAAAPAVANGGRGRIAAERRS